MNQVFEPSLSELLEAEELALAREPLRKWLLGNSRTDAAFLVFRSWLDRNGEIALVRQAFGEWLEITQSSRRPGFCM